MNKVIISLALGASALFATAASAAPLSNGIAVMPDNGIENVRMVCDDNGRCWQSAVSVAWSLRIPTITHRGSATSNGAATMTADITMMVRASASALVRAA